MNPADEIFLKNLMYTPTDDRLKRQLAICTNETTREANSELTVVDESNAREPKSFRIGRRNFTPTIRLWKRVFVFSSIISIFVQ